jgi:hypothetical protein
MLFDISLKLNPFADKKVWVELADFKTLKFEYIFPLYPHKPATSSRWHSAFLLAFHIVPRTISATGPRFGINDKYGSDLSYKQVKSSIHPRLQGDLIL